MASTDPLALDCRPDELLDAVHALLERAWAAHPEVGEVDRMMIVTAVGEIAANVVEHGATATVASLSVAVDDDGVRVELWDDGDPLPADTVTSATMPDDPLAESGRGIALARDAMDELTYRRDGERNHWSMARRR